MTPGTDSRPCSAHSSTPSDHPFLWIIVDPAEAPGLFRDLSPEAVAEIGGADDTFFTGLVADWRGRGWIGDVAPEVLAGLGRALYAVSLHRDLVGEGAYEAVVDELVAGLAERLAPPGVTRSSAVLRLQTRDEAGTSPHTARVRP